MKKELVRKELDSIFHANEQKDFVLIAIDGMCASGKTTLCKELSGTYDCNIFHTDDFFLRPEQRTKERLSEVGGNIDYERFKEELLLPLLAGQPFSYRPYSCRAMEFSGAVAVTPKKWNIIEGVYSFHPYFGEVYDYKFFMDIEVKEQKRRILERNGPEKYERFLSEWIPKENAYFAALLKHGNHSGG